MGELLFAGSAIAAGLALIPFGYKCIYQPLANRRTGDQIDEEDKYSVVQGRPNDIEATSPPPSQASEENEDDEESFQKLHMKKTELNRDEVAYNYDSLAEQNTARVGSNLWEKKMGSDIRSNTRKEARIASVGRSMAAYENYVEETQQPKHLQPASFIAQPVQPIKKTPQQIMYNSHVDFSTNKLAEPRRNVYNGWEDDVDVEEEEDRSQVRIDISKFMNK